MRSAPEVIPITDFRQDAAGIIGHAVASGAPVYVTQHGRVTAVVVSRQAYDHLLHRLAVLEADTAGSDVATNALSGAVGEPVVAAVPERAGTGRRGGPTHEPARGQEDRLPHIGSSGLIKTRFGLVDAETADFLVVEGFGGWLVGDEAGADEGGVDEGGVEEDGVDEDGVDEDGVDEDGVDEGGADEGGADEGGADEGGDGLIEGEAGPTDEGWGWAGAGVGQ